jgi:hypothetical protein
VDERRRRLRRPLAMLACMATALLWSSVSVAQQADAAARLFDPTRLTLQQSFGYLTTATKLR